MRKREPNFDLGFLDFVRIAFAALFTLSGFYLIFRSLFGPPIIGPELQAKLRHLQQHPQVRAQPAPVQAVPEQTLPGESNVFIAPAKPRPR